LRSPHDGLPASDRIQWWGRYSRCRSPAPTLEMQTVRSGTGEPANVALKRMIDQKAADGWRVRSVSMCTPDLRQYVFERPRKG
jgi:hypothetical protein